MAMGADGQLVPEGRGGVGQPKMDVAVLGQRGEHQQVVGVQPGGAEDRQPFGKITGLGLRAAAWQPPLGPVRAGLAHQAHCAAGARARPARPGRRAAAARRRRRRGPGPSGRPWPAGSRRTRRRDRPDAGAVDQRRPARSGSVPMSALGAEVVPQQCRPGLAAAAVDHSQQRPHCAVWLPRDRLLPSALPARARVTSRRGDGKSTPAHTPSLRPGAAP